mmetsp:Transcript_70944/g.123103  ORF Transcript_70944/g.123103 Transcript_70944/m.123103 type:complete len:459 (+) Transcript_70944:3-1379(+)
MSCIGVGLLVLSIALHWISRCPVICFACSGDFYHQLNIGMPWQGKCVTSDIVLSITSLSLGALGLVAGLVPQIRRDLLTFPCFGVLWLGTGALVARRCILAFALVFGMPSAFFNSFTANCAAASHSANTQRFAVVSSSAGMNFGPDMGQCLDLQQKEYTQKHGYELINTGDCRELFRTNRDVLPQLPAKIAAQLAKDGFHAYCKEAMLLVTLETRPEIGWVFWLDYDAVITSLDMKLEDFVPAAEVDFILTIGSEDSVDFELPPGSWHSVFPHVPEWSTTAGRFNSGAFMIRNSASAKAQLAKALTLDFGTDDQRAMGTAIFSMSNASSAVASVDGDVITLESLAVRALLPRCMNAHPMSWSPWARWLPGDFVSHNWGLHKAHFTLDACVAESHADWRTRALVLWNLRKGFFEGMLCAATIWVIAHYLYQIREAANGETKPLLKPLSNPVEKESFSFL